MGASNTEALQGLWGPLPGLLLPGLSHHSSQCVPQPQVKNALLSLTHTLPTVIFGIRERHTRV